MVRVSQFRVDPMEKKSRQRNPAWNLMHCRLPWMQVDGLLGQLGDFKMVPSTDCRRTNMTAYGNKKEVSEKKHFPVQSDVSNFNPNDLSVRVVGRDLIIDGKHEERQDDHGFISRSFTRRYEVPEDVDEDKVVGQLSKDGKLKLEAPMKEAIEDTPQEGMGAIKSEAAQDTFDSDTEVDEDYSSMSE